MENFSMVVAKLADSWVRGGRFSMRTGRRGCVSETGVVGVDPAVCYPYNNARGVQSQRPVGVVVKRTVLKERCGLPVSGMGFEDGFHPKDPVNAQNGLENLEVRRGHRERAREVSRDVQRRRQDGQAKLIQVKSDCFHTAVREARFEENSVVSCSACGIQAESKFSRLGGLNTDSETPPLCIVCGIHPHEQCIRAHATKRLDTLLFQHRPSLGGPDPVVQHEQGFTAASNIVGQGLETQSSGQRCEEQHHRPHCSTHGKTTRLFLLNLFPAVHPRASAFKDGWQVGGPDEGLSSLRNRPVWQPAPAFLLRHPRSRC